MTIEGTFFRVLNNLVKAKAEVYVYVGNNFIDGVVTCVCDDCIMVNGVIRGPEVEHTKIMKQTNHVVPLDAIVDIGIQDDTIHPFSG